MNKLLFPLFLALLLIYSCQPSLPTADLLIFNGEIYTVDSLGKVEAVAVKDGKILATGRLKELEQYKGEKTEEIDLQGKTMIPGFIESHAHLLGLGKQARQLDLMKCQSYEALLEKVAEAVKTTPKGEWILGRGWHQSKWTDSFEVVTGYQTHKRLSELTPDHPVMLIHASGHALFANEVAMRMAQISPETPAGEDGEIIHYNDKRPTGIFTENAMELIRNLVPEDSQESLYKDLQAGIEQCLRYGITSFQDAGSDAKAIAVYRMAIEKKEFPIRLWTMLSYSNYDTEKLEEEDPFLEEWFKKGPEIGDQLTIRAVKLYADGALGSRGAWLIDSYLDRPEHYGNPTLPIKVIEKIAEKGLRSGFQVCTHAIGDRANREVLNAYEKALKAHPEKASDHRFRIEHAQHVSEADMPRFQELGVIASVQAIHFASDRLWAIDRLGQMRIAMGAYQWKRLVASGAKVINGTDAPVEPLDPLPCFYTTVTRKTRSGEALEVDQKLSREEALRTYTIDAAYGAFEEKVKGSISPGKFADFTVLSKDIMTIPEEEILKTVVEMTIVGGKVAYIMHN